MPDSSASKRVEAIVTSVDDLLATTDFHLKVATRLMKAIAKQKDDLEKEAWPVVNLEGILSNVRRLAEVPALPNVKDVASHLSEHISALTRELEKALREQLKKTCEERGVAAAVTGEHIHLGPFSLKYDAAKGNASLDYSRAEIAHDLPLDPAVIIDSVEQFAAALLEPPVDLKRVANELEEAVLVVQARGRKSSRGVELRAELPAVYREMSFIRQSTKSRSKKIGLDDYPLARFVVEVASVVRSDENLNAEKSFRLETAVIENTGNSRKSVFIPKKLEQGFGEGMFYQALVLRQQT